MLPKHRISTWPSAHSILSAWILLLASAISATAATGISVQYGHDSTATSFFSGTANPPGDFLAGQNAGIDLGGPNVPGYLNDISGGSNGGATGGIYITDPVQNDIELVAIAAHIKVATGNFSASGGLSDEQSAIATIDDDLNPPYPFGDDPRGFNFEAYPYDDTPLQFAAQTAALSAGESANGGQPFDMLIAITYPYDASLGGLGWAFDFSGVVGLDDIVSLNFTDIGAISDPIPEPTGACIGLAICMLISRRPKHRPEKW